MSDDNKDPAEAYAEELAELMEHANRDEHIPACPFYKDKKKKASSGAVSNAYRSGWDTVFGGVKIGQA